jgi:hypothetical protein
VLRQVDAPGEGAHRAFADEQPLVLADLLLARGADAEDAAVDGHLDGGGVHAWKVEAQDHVVVAAQPVHRHDGRGGVEGLAGQLAELALELLKERVDGREKHLCIPPWSLLWWQLTSNHSCRLPLPLMSREVGGEIFGGEPTAIGP